MLPSMFATPVTDGVGVAAATVVVSKPDATLNSAASKITKLLVKPVSKLAVDSEKPLHCEPVLDRVLRLNGAKPAESAIAFPVDAAHTNAPGATEVTLLMTSVRVACKMTALTGLFAGFQIPTIGCADAVKRMVAADSAVGATVVAGWQPIENRPP